MPRLRAPGVYFEPSDPPPRRIAEVRTDIAGFVGVAERGPLHVPVWIESWTQFRTRFGEQIEDGFLAYAVKGFFANGGRSCWVVRVGVANQLANRASLLLLAARDKTADKLAGFRPVFRVKARDPGPGSERLAVRVEAAPGGRFSLFVECAGEVLEVWRDLDPVPDRLPRPENRYAPRIINGSTIAGAEARQPDESERTELGSLLIQLEDLTEGDARESDRRARLPLGVAGPAQPRGRILWESEFGRSIEYTQSDASEYENARPLRTGYLGFEQRATPVLTGLTLDHFTGENQPPDRWWGVKALERVDEVAIVAVPDLLWPGTVPPRTASPRPQRCHVLPRTELVPRLDRVPDERTGLNAAEMVEGQRAVLRHCSAMHDRFAVLDAPAKLDAEATIAWAKQLQSETGQFGALYSPWVYAPEPQRGENVRLIPPSGHVAGTYARVDRTIGVQKPPANEVLEEIRGVESEFDAVAHGWLNDEGINAIRAYPARGIRIAGGRTLVRPNDPDTRQWRYVHVRRLLLMFEEAIDQSSQWIVFAENRPERWREIDRVVRAFLDDQWRRGRLDGETAEEAYQVSCDRTTNPVSSVNAGRMVCEIAVRPPYPAEFVVVRLGRRVGETGAVSFGG